MRLRSGAKTEDPRLDRLVQFDERSRAFPIRAAVTAEQLRKPRSYTWSVPAVLDQGREGACVGFAWAHELLAKPAMVQGAGYQFAREQVYWEAQKIDPWSGGAYPGASPWYEGTSILAGAKIVHGLGYMQEYRWAFSLNELLVGISYRGPAVLGINWYQGFYQPDAKHFIHPTGGIVGGHAIVANGVSMKGEFVKLHNSWGPSYGDGGHCYISFADLDRLLHEDGEACLPMGRRAKP